MLDANLLNMEILACEKDFAETKGFVVQDRRIAEETPRIIYKIQSEVKSNKEDSMCLLIIS